VEPLSLLPARAEHYDFALSLYLETMEPYASELMVWDLGKQKAGFAALWKPEDVRIIMREDRALGWLQFKETEQEIFLQQIFVSPPHQRQGIGEMVMRRLLGTWRETGKPVRLMVLKNNPARRLYERLGFATIGDDGLKFEMQLCAAAS
jgi:ribosomal protein S18 acetylase RimI-like enzyme